MDTTNPSWLSTWQAICDQEAQAKIRRKKFMDEWYRIETKMKLMDLRVDASLRMRDEYLHHLFKKYPNWKPHFSSYGLRPANTTPDYQSDLYRMMEAEMIRNFERADSYSGNSRLFQFSQMPQHTYASGPLLPSSYFQGQHLPAPTLQNGPLVPSHAEGPLFNDPSQIAELKNDMAQIKNRLDDITVYLRDLKHSAIALTTSVSRRSSVRDKSRRRGLVGEDQFDERGEEKNIFIDGNMPEVFAEKLKEKLSNEQHERNVHLNSYQKEHLTRNEPRYPEEHKPEPHHQQQKRPETKVPQATSKQHVSSAKSPPYSVTKAKQTSDDQSKSTGPRYNFSASPDLSEAEPEPPKPTSIKQKQPPPPAKFSDEEDTSETASPPATKASWLMADDKPKQAAQTVAQTKSKNVKAERVVPTQSHRPADDSSVASTPEMAPKLRPPPDMGRGYQALLGVAAKDLDKSQMTKRAEPDISSDSDDLEAQLNTASKKRGTGTVNVASDTQKAAKKTEEPGLLAALGFEEDSTSRKAVSFLADDKPKTAPAKVSSSAVVASKTAPATKSAEAPAARKNAAMDDPDDFLKQLFPDKFSSTAAAATKDAASNVGGARKKKSFFIGDESDSEIDLPHGSKKTNDMDDDFFFR